MSKAARLDPDVFFALFSDRTRLRLLNLMRGGEICVCDLVGGLDVPQPTASRHLAMLRRAGLVAVRKQGLWSYYTLAPVKSGLHGKLLECLEQCAKDSPEFAADETRMKKARRARQCCE